MAKSRLIGDYPVIGIRPTIDGRRGKIKVRESLEDQTMNMAHAAAELIRNNVRYSNGEPVKVIIADTTIGRVAEAAACADKFRNNVDITLTVTPCWCYGAETMDMDPMTIKAVWGFNGTERPRCGVPCQRTCNSCAKGFAGFRHLRTRSAGRRRHDYSARRARQNFAFCPRGSCRCHNARQELLANR